MSLPGAFIRTRMFACPSAAPHPHPHPQNGRYDPAREEDTQLHTQLRLSKDTITTAITIASSRSHPMHIAFARLEDAGHTQLRLSKVHYLLHITNMAVVAVAVAHLTLSSYRKKALESPT